MVTFYCLKSKYDSIEKDILCKKPIFTKIMKLKDMQVKMTHIFAI